MRRRPLLGALMALAALALIASGASAQGMNGLYTRDGIEVIAVGDNATLYRSLDGGYNWTEHSLGSGTLRDIAGRGYTMVVVGDNGAIWKSVDSGGNWSLTTIPGTPTLRCVAMPTDTDWYVAGSTGVIYKSTNQGGSWSAQSSGTIVRLYKLAFTDGSHGWAAGENGTLLRTTNGGANWSPVSLGSPNHLYGVDQQDNDVWVVGAEGTAFKSTNGGADFSPVNLKLDARADVRAVVMESPDSLWLAGGGGFVRFSTDGGATWTFQVTKMYAPILDLVRNGSRLWAANSKNRVVIFTIDRGNYWRLPTGTTSSKSWGNNPKYVGSFARGSGFALNPVYKSTIYCAIGSSVVRSRDDGETWSVAATIPSAYNRCNAFVISPKDSNLWLEAVSGSSVSDRVLRTVNAGAKWDTVLTHDFGEYGIPLEVDPDHPDTVYFGGELSNASNPPLDQLRVSYDFGANWTTVGGAAFRSPCDIVAVPDNPGVIVVGDGVTGSGTAKFYRSLDYGQTFTEEGSGGSSEIPGLANSRLRPGFVFGTNWGSGGLKRSTNMGDSWATINTQSDAWGIDIAKDDPNVLMFGKYGSPYSTFFSPDSGASFETLTPVSQFINNYSFLLRDRATILAEQGSGIWKLSFNYTYVPVSGSQTLTLTAPNGGEVLTPGSTYHVTWNETNLGLARLEYRRAPGEPWQLIADTPGYYNAYEWTVPYDGTTQAKIRVYDVWDGAPGDSSNAVFTISAPRIAETPDPIGFGTVSVGSSTVVPMTIQNIGVTPLNVTSITTGTARFAVGRTTLTVAAGDEDTVGVWFFPAANQVYNDVATIVSNDLGHTPLEVALTGTGTNATVQVLAPNGGESWQWNTLHPITWSSVVFSAVDLAYRVHPDSAWITIAEDVPASPASYNWTIPLHPTSTAQVRVENSAGAPIDVSDAPFSLTVPFYASTPDTVHLTVAQIGSEVVGELEIQNPGTAPLAVTSVTISGAEFWVGRSSLVVPAGGSDTVGVFYAPNDAGYDTAQVTIVANDPDGSHEAVAEGRGVVDLAVIAHRPLRFALAQNRPNPFSLATTIEYTLAQDADVSLDVYDIAGHRVATLARGRQPAGEHRVRFGAGARTGASAGRFPPGVYFLRFEAGPYSATRKMLLVN